MHELKLISKAGKERYYAFKPLQSTLPKLSEADYEDLKEDIKKNGLIEPIKVIKLDKSRHVVLDGVHRLKAVDELGWFAKRFKIKMEFIEAKKEDWFKLGLVMNLSAKRGRQIKKRDLVKALYKEYKERVEKPSLEEFRKELESCGLYLTLETIRTYTHGAFKPEHHRHKPRGDRAVPFNKQAQKPENAQIPTVSTKSVVSQNGENAQKLGNAQIPPVSTDVAPKQDQSNTPKSKLETHNISADLSDVLTSLNTSTEELTKCLRKLTPDLESIARAYDYTPLEALSKCVEVFFSEAPTYYTSMQRIADSINTDVEELIECLRELVPTLRVAAKRFKETPLNILRKCVEVLMI